MDFEKATAILSAALVEKCPEHFSGTWVYRHAPRAYRFFRLNLRTPTGNIDWDAVTRALDPCLQSKWQGRRRKAKKLYENHEEVALVLAKYKDSLYTVIIATNEYEKRLRDRILVTLVRLAQKGNLTARQEAVTYIRYSVDDWIEKYYVLQRWSGFGDLLEEEIAACIRRYRFTGTVLGYVFKTLELRGRGLAPLYSLDKPLFPLGGRTWAERVVQDTETGEIKMYETVRSSLRPS